MFLRNFYNYLAVITGFLVDTWSSGGRIRLSSEGLGNVSAWNGNYINVRTPSGNISKVFLRQVGNSSYCDVHAPLTMWKKSICIGDGSTPVYFNDYQLSGNVIDFSEAVEVSNEYVYDDETNMSCRRAVFTYTNNTEADITIREWGMCCTNYNGSPSDYYYSNTSNNHFLIYREVLQNPIVIPAGESATLEFTVNTPWGAVQK